MASRSLLRGLAAWAVLFGGAQAFAAELVAYQSAFASPQVQPALLQMWIPKYLGYFQQEGLEVSVNPTAGSSDVAQRLLAKSLDSGVGDVDFMLNAGNEGRPLPLRLFYLYQLKSQNTIGVDAASPIREIKDLKGKTVGVISLSHSGYLYLRKGLEKTGLNPDNDVKYVVLGQGLPMLDALKTKKVDAIAAFTSLYAIYHTQGYDVRPLPAVDARTDGIGTFGFAARESDLVAGSPARANQVKYARAVLKGTLFAITNPNVACRIHFEVYPEALAPSISYSQNVANCEHIWRDRMVEYDRRQFKLDKWGTIDPAKIELEAEIMGWPKADVKSIFTNDLINDINAGIDEAAVIAQATNFCTSSDSAKALCAKK